MLSNIFKRIIIKQYLPSPNSGEIFFSVVLKISKFMKKFQNIKSKSILKSSGMPSWPKEKSEAFKIYSTLT